MNDEQARQKALVRLFSERRQTFVKNCITNELEDENSFQKHRGSQYEALLDDLTKAAQEFALANGLTPDEFEDGPLQQATSLVSSLKYACERLEDRTGKKPKLHIWFHQDNAWNDIQAKKFLFFDKETIEEIVGRYLNLPFRSPSFDRVLVDILVAMEFYGYCKYVTADPAYELGLKTSPMQAPHPVGVFFKGWAAVGAVTFAGYLVLQYLDLFSSGFVTLIGVIVLAFLLFAFADALFALPGKSKEFASAKGKLEDLMSAMNYVYLELRSSGPISAQRIKTVCEQTQEKGCVWPAPLYPLLDDICSRTGRF